MWKKALLVLIPAAIAPLGGCAPQPFTRDRFEMVRDDVDTRDDVLQLLGKPRKDLGDQWVYDDLKRHRTAIIYFSADGHVVRKEWMNAKTGEWEGASPHTDPPPAGEVRERTKTNVVIDDD